MFRKIAAAAYAQMPVFVTSDGMSYPRVVVIRGQSSSLITRGSYIGSSHGNDDAGVGTLWHNCRRGAQEELECKRGHHLFYDRLLENYCFVLRTNRALLKYQTTGLT